MGETNKPLSRTKAMLLKSAGVLCMLMAIGCLSFGAGWLWIDTQYLQMGISPNSLLVLAALGIGCAGLHGVFSAAQQLDPKKVEEPEVQEDVLGSEEG